MIPPLSFESEGDRDVGMGRYLSSFSGNEILGEVKIFKISKYFCSAAKTLTLALKIVEGGGSDLTDRIYGA